MAAPALGLLWADQSEAAALRAATGRGDGSRLVLAFAGLVGRGLRRRSASSRGSAGFSPSAGNAAVRNFTG
jgi:hypothetical protein